MTRTGIIQIHLDPVDVAVEARSQVVAIRAGVRSTYVHIIKIQHPIEKVSHNSH